MAGVLKPLAASKKEWSKGNIHRGGPGGLLIKAKLNEMRLTEAELYPNNPSVCPATSVITAKVGEAWIHWRFDC